MQRIEVSAPGKLFLVGEYAVIDGAPALLTAVDRRVRVGLTPAEDGHWRLHAANLDIVDLDLGPHGVADDSLTAEQAHKLRVFAAVRQVLFDQLETPLAPQRVEIDSSDFARDGYKLGLGSSAAVAAALMQALAIAANLPLSRPRLCALAIRAHRQAQDGAGSGGDVAASVYGGVIRYVRDHAPQPLTWPGSLEGMAVVTGTGASTADLVARVKAYGRLDPNGYAADLARLAWLADTAQHALSQTSRFLQLAKEYYEALLALDHHAGAGIIVQRHRTLHALAARHRGVFKTSGAGGGDVGLAFARRGTDADQLRAALENAGAHVVALAFGAEGVRLES
ncbi:hypothetical protein [Salinisphaera sp. T31B1]|uniref:mevalonate kinase family protein n=1 Tax=Salinisphaera sp. T31B1 TaxID=727963 RepID=UPI0033405DA8